MQVQVVNPNLVRDISPLLVDEQGRLRVVDADVLRGTTPHERMLFGVRNACYVLPTTELVEHIKTLIAGRSAIEIGAGNGVLSRALGIPATDNHQQSWPHIKAHYQMLQQPVIRYGDNVEVLGAKEALKKHRPQVVVACWVTHRYNAARHAAGGNQDGVDEQELLKNCEDYIFIGNEQVHKGKAIWKSAHQLTFPDFVFSRAANGTRDFLSVWRGSASR